MKEKCLKCIHPSKSCISYLLTLTTPELCEWCRMWKDRLGWSNAYLSMKSNVPKGTVDRVLGHNDKGVNLVTIRPIICAIIGCTVEEMKACEKDNGSVAELEAENQKLKEQIQRIEKAVDEVKEERRKSVDFLKKQLQQEHKDSIFRKRLAILFFVCAFVFLGIIITAIVIDWLNHNVGFFWLSDTLYSVFGADGITTNGINNIIEWRL